MRLFRGNLELFASGNIKRRTEPHPGARGQIANVNENSPNAVKVLAIWDTVFQEVLSERDWKFAKTRQILQLSDVVHAHYRYAAWALPADLLRFVLISAPVLSTGSYWFSGGLKAGWYHRDDPPFWPVQTDYKVETLTAGWTSRSLILRFPSLIPSWALHHHQLRRVPRTGHDHWSLISDPTQLMPGFVNCLCFRLAQKLAIPVTESLEV